MNAEERFGYYYEDLEPGTLIKHWPGKTITDSDNN